MSNLNTRVVDSWYNATSIDRKHFYQVAKDIRTHKNGPLDEIINGTETNPSYFSGNVKGMLQTSLQESIDQNIKIQKYSKGTYKNK